MKDNLYFQIFKQLIPVFFGLLFGSFLWQNNLLLTLVFVGIIAAMLLIEHYPGDIIALLLGIIMGFIIEIIGTSVVGYQSFTNPDFLGIPMWLPFAWGYALMVMKRIGVIIYENHKHII
ncbi:hypothetical protein C4553_02730 [Candidatus Parcubacteria bacterium]|nr:MAG: hypothetical protein C4553_02730 [Candidatus Parcubacteria bacterium]